MAKPRKLKATTHDAGIGKCRACGHLHFVGRWGYGNFPGRDSGLVRWVHECFDPSSGFRVLHCICFNYVAMPAPKRPRQRVEEIDLAERQTSSAAPDSSGPESRVDTEAIHTEGIVSSGRTSHNDASLDASAD